MNIRANRYNDPALGAAFENLASIFAPPSAQDVSAYATASAKKAEAERLAWLFANPNDPLADRKATMAGVYSPTQSYYAQDQNNATVRYNIDTDAATSLATNAADNARALSTNAADNATARYDIDTDAATSLATNAADNARALSTNAADNQFGIAKQFMTPLNEGQVQPGLPGSVASQFGVPELPRTEGLPKPLGETEQKALERQQLRGNGMLTDTMLLDTILGSDAPVKTVGPEGPVYMTPGAAARTGAPAFEGETSQPTSILEFEYARENGFTGTYDQWVTAKAKAAATSIQIGAEKKEAQRADNANIASDVVNTATDRALSADKGRILGNAFGMLASYVPGTANSEVYKQVDVLKSNATIEALNAMRAASPTGGALGSVTDRENAMLAAKAGMLDPASPNFQRDLLDYQRTLLRTIHGSAEGDRIFAEQVAARANGGAVPPAPAGVDPALWEFMTPEERALFQ